MSDWSFIHPEETINQVLNPVAGTTGNFAAVGGSATRVTTYAKWGLYSYRVQTAANNQGMTLTLDALANAIHYVTLMVRGTLPASWDWSVDNVNWTTPALLLQIDDDWALYGAQFPAAQCNGSTTLRIYQDGAGSGDFYVDGVQVEEKEYWTTLAMGDLAGCEWLGAAHASTSQRSAMSRAGGRLRDFCTDYYFCVAKDVGTGVMPIRLNIDPYALGPGGELNSIAEMVREFSLYGPLVPSDGDLDAARQALELALAHNAYPPDEDGWQAVRIWYTGGNVIKEIAAHYQGGLEGAEGLDEAAAVYENLLLRFRAPDPFWYEIGESAAVLDTNDTATLRYIGARLRETGQWDDLGLVANPGANGDISTICVASDRSVYVGGTFQSMNGVAGRDYIARYVPDTDTWETVGGASDFNNTVYKILEGPDGTIYAAGQFTNVAGNGNADYLVQWDGATWSNVGIPVAGTAAITYALDLAFDSQGILYIVGDFDDWANIANADGVVSWDGSAYAAVGAPAIGGTNVTYAVAVDSQDRVYIGGSFLNCGGDPAADRLAVWDGTSWSAVAGVTPNLVVFDIEITWNDLVYIGGSFTDLAGIDEADRIAVFDGTAFRALDIGVNNNTVYALHIAPDGDLYVGGSFTMAGGLATTNRVARWTGSSWTHLDVDLPGSPTINTIEIGEPDPVITKNYDLWLGFNTTGTATLAGSTSIANDGTAHVFPQFAVNRSGGTSAILISVRNETIGQILLFNYALLDGETLTVDMDPLALSIVSSHFGPRLEATLSGDDFGDWSMQAGANEITCFVDESGTPTILAYLLWRDAYLGKN